MIRIEKASLEFIPSIFDIYKKSYFSTYLDQVKGAVAEDFEELFSVKSFAGFSNSLEKRIFNDNPNDITLFVFDKQAPIGICRVRIFSDYNQIQSFYLLPEYTNKGVGGKTMSYITTFFNKNNKTIVQVAKENFRAIKFYEKHGFSKAKESQEYSNDSHTLPVSKTKITEVELTKKPE